MTTLLLSLTGCALVTLKSPEKPLSVRDLNARILTHEFAAHFIFAVEQTADEIASGSDTPRIQLNTLRWKISAASASERAVSQMAPMLGLLDTWALAVQMREYLDSGRGSALFGPQQASAVKVATVLARKQKTWPEVSTRRGNFSVSCNSSTATPPRTRSKHIRLMMS